MNKVDKINIQIKNYEYELDKESKRDCPDINYVLYCRNKEKSK